jgi:2-haloacid dehalogenase
MSISSNHSLAVVFDFGGVLFDWSPLYLYKRLFNCDEAAAAAFLKEVDFFTWNEEQDRGRPFDEAVADLTRAFPQYAGLIQSYHDYYIESIGGAIQSSVEILYRLKRSGYTLFALSNWSVEKFELIRPHYDFLTCFQEIFISGEMKLIKPDPRIFEVFLERVHRQANECLFIDDSPENIASASRLGFNTIYYRSPEQLDRDLRQAGVLA